MVALVRIALSRLYTVVVPTLLIVIVGPLAGLRTPTDIFPDILIPVVGVVWQYGIEHIAANTYSGAGIIKVFFQPNVDIRAPLGRAVIGDLVFARSATLMFVPAVFSMVHSKQGASAAARLEMQHAH